MAAISELIRTEGNGTLSFLAITLWERKQSLITTNFMEINTK